VEAYYVINNRIPRFPIQSGGSVAEKHQAKLRESFQLWLVEKMPSNLQRRKACSQCFEFTKWLESKEISIEQVALGLFEQWLLGSNINDSENIKSVSRSFGVSKKEKKLVDFDEFLIYARHKVPDIKWSTVHTVP
jgi:hypothetical protein